MAEAQGEQTHKGLISEDCLSLTIWTPAADDAGRPVFVWLHGGGFIQGAGSLDIYSGEKLAEQGDMVVVGINYRLGPFGCLHLGDDDAVGGNRWLSDQLLALEWIRGNVAAFGGDPERITLGGQSAGGWATAAILALPEPPPIARAVVLSAGLALKIRSHEESVAFTQLYREILGVASIDELRALDTDALVAGIWPALMAYQEFGGVALPFMPTADEPMLSQDVTPAFVNRCADLDVLVGWTANEMGVSLPMDPAVSTASREDVVERMRASFGERADDAYDTYVATGLASPAEVLIRYNSDELLRMPSLDFARRINAHGGRAWTYQFDVPSPMYDGLAGACHCLDIPFLFDVLEITQSYGGKMLDGVDLRRIQPVADEMHAALIAFVHGKAPWPIDDVKDFSLAPSGGDVVPRSLIELWDG